MQRRRTDLVKNQFVEEHYQSIALQPISALYKTQQRHSTGLRGQHKTQQWVSE